MMNDDQNLYIGRFLREKEKKKKKCNFNVTIFFLLLTRKNRGVKAV